MTENEKARESITIPGLTVKVDPQNGWYLKQFAALQFEGSIDNFGTNMPIHVLEQQVPSSFSIPLSDAVDDGADLDGAEYYVKDSSFSSVSDLVMSYLNLYNENDITKYNSSHCRPFIPFEKLSDCDELPRFLEYVDNERDYIDAYTEDTNVHSQIVSVAPMTSSFEPMGYAFTHQELEYYQKSIDNHIFHFCRTYAHAGEQYSRRVGDFYPIMEFLHSAGEQLLREDIKRYDIYSDIRTEEEMHEFYRTQPDEMVLAAYVEVNDKVSGKRYCSIRVWCAGHEVKTGTTGSYYVLNKHYLTVNKNDMVATFPYPFSCDDGINSLLKTKDTDILTPVERLFLWTEYKNPNPIEIKKNKESVL